MRDVEVDIAEYAEAARVATVVSKNLPMTERKKPDPVGLTAARQVAEYEIGDASWAYVIIDAYLNPEAALDELAFHTEGRART